MRPSINTRETGLSRRAVAALSSPTAMAISMGGRPTDHVCQTAQPAIGRATVFRIAWICLRFQTGSAAAALTSGAASMLYVACAPQEQFTITRRVAAAVRRWKSRTADCSLLCARDRCPGKATGSTATDSSCTAPALPRHEASRDELAQECSHRASPPLAPSVCSGKFSHRRRNPAPSMSSLTTTVLADLVG